MNTDIRVDVGFLDHWKTEALIESCGPEGVLSLLRIWVFTAQNKPNGELSGIPIGTIERVAKWKGEKGALQKCLEDLRFLEQKDGAWCLHDWQEHNPYAANAEWRKDRARKANAARWGRKDENSSYKDATSKQQESTDDPPPPSPPPVPSPSPPPKKNRADARCFTPPSVDEVVVYCRERKNDVDPNKWHDFYSAKGWMVGKNKMKDWRAAVRTWEQQRGSNGVVAGSEPTKEEVESLEKLRVRKEIMKRNLEDQGHV